MTELKNHAIFWQIWSLNQTRPVKLAYINFVTDPTQPDPRVNPTRVQLCADWGPAIDYLY